MFKLILFIFALILSSCSSDDTSDLLIDQNLYEDNKLDDLELYKNANKFITQNQLDAALIEIDKIEVLYPSSYYATKSMLLESYIYFLKEEYETTRAIAENYQKYYPGSKDMVYAYYLEAMTYYVLIKRPDYSQKNASKAKDKFNFILNAYPNSIYEIDIVTRLQIIDNNLAANKLSTAKFYLNKNNLNGALVYLKDIYNNHSSSTSIEETLYQIVSVYKKIGEDELAKDYAAILGFNFPDSKWYNLSYKLIYNLENMEEKENWFYNFNPIKLFDRNQKQEKFDIQKID